MATLFVSHDDCLLHITPQGHPERVDRLVAINERLMDQTFDDLHRVDAPMGSKEQVLRGHPETYFEMIKTSCPDHGHVSLDGDTHICKDSFNAAMRGVGGICHAIDTVMKGDVKNAFCATRPPGHHAETQTPMGFCLFGTAALGAKHALAKHGLSRVAIVDFDVHHGNGTQDLVWNDPNIMLVTSQQMPLWPGTGDASEKGAHDNVINLPLTPNSAGDVLMDAYKNDIFPRLTAFKPDFLIISAGFDAHENDPLANLDFSTQDFRDITEMLCGFADKHCQGRVVSTLEGGYDLGGLADGVDAHIGVLMEHSK